MATSDYTSKGDEAGVQWGDLAMLPILAESIGSVLTRHSMVFLAVGGQKNEAGAKFYLDQLSPEQRKKIHAVVAIDHIGRTPMTYAVPGSDSGLEIRTGRYRGIAKSAKWDPSELPITRSIPTAARRWNLPEPVKNDESGLRDTKPFRHEGIPAVTFTSPSWVVTGYVGSNPLRDYRTVIDFREYNKTYLFLCAYLLFLDRDLGAALPAPGPQTQITEVSTPGVPAQSQAATVKPESSATATNGSSAGPTTSAPVVAANIPTPPPASAAPDTAAPDNTPVFRATTRLVQVDVVVTDKQGHPITGLKQSDFTLMQDGRLQPSRVFEEHTARESAPAESVKAVSKPASTIAPNTYSNLPDTQSTQSRTILLFDMLNTPLDDQKSARNQLLKLAKSLPSGQQTALFTLTDSLQMVEAFTGDANELVLAVQHLNTLRSPLLTTEAERQQAVGTATYIAAESVPSVPTNPQAAAEVQASMTNRSLGQFKTMESLRTNERVTFTLDAFAGLARSVAGYPGRKNLIWLSGSFPIQIEPDPAIQDRWRTDQNFRVKLSETVALLTQSRIAVYPVDIRGMQMRSIDIGTSVAQSTAFIGGDSSGSGAASADKTGGLLADQEFTGMNERESMTEVAEQTGGRAFINTNDFSGAIARAMDDGSHYYTLAYTPDTKDEPATFHRIELKLPNHSDAKLSYRRGYFSQPQISSAQAGLVALQGALQSGMPPSTMIYFTASVKLPDVTHKSVQLNYVVSPNNVTFEDTANGGKHVVVDCMAIAFNREGKEVAHASDTLDGTLPGSAYQATLNRGLPASQELDLKPGTYNLRVGVQDRASQQIGTLDIPITVQ